MRVTPRRAAMATATAILLFVAVGPAFAAESLEAKWRHACLGDAFSFCTFHALANDRPGVRDCLVRNIDHISKACRAVISDAHGKGIKNADVPDETTSAQASGPTPH